MLKSDFSDQDDSFDSSDASSASDPSQAHSDADAEFGALPSATADEAPPKPARKRRPRRKKATKTAPSEEEVATDDGPSEESEPAPKSRSKRSSKKKATARRRVKPKRRASKLEPAEEAQTSEVEPAESEATDRDDHADPVETEEPKRKRRRGSRGGRRRSKAKKPEADEAVGIDHIPGEDDDFEEEIAAGERRSVASTSTDGKKKRRGGRGSRRRGLGRAEAEDRDDDEEEATTSGRRGRRKSRSKSEDSDLEPKQTAPVVRDQRILVNAVDPEETRVVVVQEGRIAELQMTVEQHKSYVNDIYRGRVVNIESAIGAAFVDFGQGRNGFLHLSDVMDFYGDEDFSLEHLLTARTEAEDWEAKGVKADEIEGEEEADPPKKSSRKAKTKRKISARKAKGRSTGKSRRRRPISEVLSKGQLVVAQITKDAIGDKGPTLTTYISIPGRYLVLMPSLERTGVSRKIEDERERRRLKRILQGLEIPEGMGVIVRTAGVGKTKADIKRDLDYLLAVWGDFSRDLVLGRSPAPLYNESDVAIRTMRDLFSERTEEVVVDDQEVYEQMVKFTERLMPEQVDRIRLHEGPKPLFHTHSIEQDFERLFTRRVELPSGGSIVIDQTEALVAIDVNSGRTRDDSADFEAVALKTNLEAVPEIARQIKLRDMGGIVVLDFIDMLKPAARRAVEKLLRECLVHDRARSKVGRISQFGLLELTRQRLGPGLSKLLFDNCAACRGTGRRRTAQSRAQALLRRMASALTQKGFTKLEVLAHPDTIAWIHDNDEAEFQELRAKHKREIVFKEIEDQLEDSVFHYLRADGREVRPGGRRKR